MSEKIVSVFVTEPAVGMMVLGAQFASGGEAIRIEKYAPAEAVVFMLRDFADRIEERKPDHRDNNISPEDPLRTGEPLR